MAKSIREIEVAKYLMGYLKINNSIRGTLNREVSFMASQIEADSREQLNPLRKSCRELFQHGKEHASQNSSFDRLVAGIHVDNALELFLKFYGARHNVRNYKKLQVPALLNELEQHLPELEQFAGDLRTFHECRNVAYHMGLPLDEYVLNWGIRLIGDFFRQVEHRERQQTRTLPNGGFTHKKYKYSEAERELEMAIKLFQELTPKSTTDEFEKVLFHIIKAIEFWVNNKFKEISAKKICRERKLSKQQLLTQPLSEKIEILRKEGVIKDSVLLKELIQLRNFIMHVERKRTALLSIDKVYRCLQIAMHFIKVKSPSIYEARIAEDQVQRILDEYKIPYKRNILMHGYSVNSRFDFVIEEKKLIIEVRHSQTSKASSIFVESLAFRIIDLKKKEGQWKFVIVLSGCWSQRSKEILRKYSDYVIKIENFRDFLKRYVV